MSLDELRVYRHYMAVRERIENVVFSLFWLSITAFVFASIFATDDRETSALRAASFAGLCLAFLAFCFSRRERRRVHAMHVEFTMLLKTLAEITSAYTWGEAIVVVGYDARSLPDLAEFLFALPQVKHVAPAGMPPWISDITKED